jgi:hypothetical protein
MSYIRMTLIGVTMILVTPSLVFAQYITTQQQRQQAQQNLQQHRQQQQSNSVQPSTSTVHESTGSYGRVWQEQQLQGNNPRAVRPW